MVGRHPLGGVPRTFLRAVHGWIRNCEVVEVAGDVPALIVSDPAVARLRQRDNMLDVGGGGFRST